jgi:hypothetical protein
MFPFPSIDLEAAPAIPEMPGQELRVQEHRGAGRLVLAAGAIKVAAASEVGFWRRLIELYCSMDKVDKLKNEPVLNANALDLFLAHQDLIPEEWKGKRVHFLGTIYTKRWDGWNYPYSRFMEWVPWKNEWVSRLLTWDERVEGDDLVALLPRN